jgi:membrane protease YdiL (CAAX protease family)
VVIFTVFILAGSIIAVGAVLDELAERDWPVPALMGVAAAVGYVPSIVWLGFVSRRWGTGRPLTDLGVRFRPSDVGWGPLVWISTTMAMAAMVQVVRGLDIPYRGNLDLDRAGAGILAADVDRTAVVALVVSAVICAPIVEEAVFRGALLRGLLSKMPAAPAIVMQGMLFGSAHFTPEFGRDNIGLILVLSVAGTGFGLAAYLLRRIGPTMIAHALLNGVAITVALVLDQ